MGFFPKGKSRTWLFDCVNEMCIGRAGGASDTTKRIRVLPVLLPTFG